MSPSTITISRKAVSKARCIDRKRARAMKNDIPINSEDSEDSTFKEKDVYKRQMLERTNSDKSFGTS